MVSFRTGQSISWSPTRIHSWSFTFSYYINDIVKRNGGSIRLFTDDTSLYIIVDLQVQAARILNADLQTISKWANSWLVTFNPSKTLSMLVSRKLNTVQNPYLFMNDTFIEETASHKHLSLTFSSTCTWKDNVYSISDKVWTWLNILRVLKFRVSRKSLEKMSHLTRKQLESIHIEAARIIPGATKRCSIEKLFIDLGWEALQSRCNKYKLVLLYKILHGLAPNYLS